MFNIEEVRKNNRTGLLISSFAAHIAAIALLLIMVLGSVHRLGKAGPPHARETFAVTGDNRLHCYGGLGPGNNSGNFNYHLSGAYGVTPAVLPNTATSHTFTRLHHGNQYWFFIYARDVGGQASGQAQVTTRTLLDTTTPSTGPVINSNRGRFQLRLRFLDSRAGRLPFSLLPSIGEWQPSASLEPKPVDHPSLSPAGDDLQLDGPGPTIEGQHWSPFSAPVSVTTLPPNPNDHTPPNTPGCECVRFWRPRDADHGGANPPTISISNPISVTTFTSTASWRRSALVRVARQPFTV